MQTHFDSEPLAKNFAPLVERPRRSRVVARLDARGDRTRRRTGERLHSRAPLSDILPAHAWSSAQLCVLPLLPLTKIRVDTRSRDERRDVAESFVGARNQSNGKSFDVELDAGDWTHSLSFCFQCEANDAAQVGGVGYADAVVSEIGSFFGECFRGDGAVAKGERCMGSKLDGHVIW